MVMLGTEMHLAVYPPKDQGTGAFDGGRITEIKPIGFSGDGSAIKRVGPLFYWAWASAKSPARIGLHPHQGFEILSYVLEGEIRHGDTLGTDSRVKEGGAQFMQTGSGVSHEEETLGDNAQFFQIWFEPDLNEALRRQPTYREIHLQEFPIEETDGVSVKAVVGKDSPIAPVADVTMRDITIAPGKSYSRMLSAGRSLAVVAISGQGVWQTDGQRIELREKDFTVVSASQNASLSVTANETEGLRVAIIEVPTEVEYPLYPKR